MTEEDLRRLEAMAKITRARMDVLERAVAIFMANSNRAVAEAIEDTFRGHIERGITHPDPIEAEKLQLADEAAVRFSDIVAQALARPR